MPFACAIKRFALNKHIVHTRNSSSETYHDSVGVEMRYEAQITRVSCKFRSTWSFSICLRQINILRDENLRRYLSQGWPLITAAATRQAISGGRIESCFTRWKERVKQSAQSAILTKFLINCLIVATTIKPHTQISKSTDLSAVPINFNVSKHHRHQFILFNWRLI